ncbi:MAG: hypothetical protein DID89_2727548641 [Candidatus Nitrotoga sp. CP45]|nr:MAG: hypothetical protein DID89_2727548641 [Candidatus Nitrotoga sp. CP45]
MQILMDQCLIGRSILIQQARVLQNLIAPVNLVHQDQTGLNTLILQEQICQGYLTRQGWRSRANLAQRGQIDHGNLINQDLIGQVNLGNRGQICQGSLVHQDLIGRANLVDRGQKCLGTLVHQDLIDRNSPIQHLRAYGTGMVALDMQALINLVAQNNQIYLKETVLVHLVVRINNVSV